MPLSKVMDSVWYLCIHVRIASICSSVDMLVTLVADISRDFRSEATESPPEHPFRETIVSSSQCPYRVRLVAPRNLLSILIRSAIITRSVFFFRFLGRSEEHTSELQSHSFISY